MSGCRLLRGSWCRYGFLTVEQTQLTVHGRKVRAQQRRLGKKGFTCHGEKLGGMLGGVGIEPGFRAGFQRLIKRLERGSKIVRPLRGVHAGMQRDRKSTRLNSSH